MVLFDPESEIRYGPISGCGALRSRPGGLVLTPGDDVVHSDKAERHGRTDGTTCAGVTVTERTARVIACCIETRDRPVVAIEDTAVSIGLEPALGAQITRIDGNGVKRWLVDRPEAGIGCDRRVAEHA